ncbi:MAG: PRC-barrel domain-containing protein [Candidatus Hydrothermarchaeales archaeon]
MTKIEGKALLTRNVVSDRGTVIGKLIDLSMETRSGKITMLVVKPSNEVDARLFKTNEYGEIYIPFNAVKAIKDVIIVNETGIPRA